MVGASRQWYEPDIQPIWLPGTLETDALASAFNERYSLVTSSRTQASILKPIKIERFLVDAWNHFSEMIMETVETISYAP